ncbi:N-acetylmuramate alpha-1-phosphate uridylyltransferase MurU [Ramlibacter rhizophilus]|uniref:Nucleotidyltransferase family protein n=1 Tax=Ramlibacter rhizophilus TaxID=1781167 RepID=A0A4Z0BFN9_9BURK|nr:nucleotidyltransferase family protein [Ramlibacter rhizophilus]TFY98146.1 nucleotidyltransferase family protein [Ramlibacter rhizophilus]
MVLAAGRGERMRPLTDQCPKPLLEVRGKPLMQWHLEALSREGIETVVVNTAWLGEQVEAAFGERAQWSDASPQRLLYSHEGRDFGGALETAGGIVRALPLLDEVFWVVAGDVFMPQFPFARQARERFMAGDASAHLWLVPNPPHNPRGDFGLASDGRAVNEAAERYTFSTVALYRKAFFAGFVPGNPQGLRAPLAPLLRAAMDNGAVTAELWTGGWTDVGTPERLAQLNAP